MVLRGAGHRESIPGPPASPLRMGPPRRFFWVSSFRSGAWGAAYAPRPARTHGLRGLTAFIVRPLWRGHTPALLPRIDSVMRPLYSVQWAIFK